MINTVLLDLYGIIYPDKNNQAADFVNKIKELGVQIIAVTNLSPDTAREICVKHSIPTIYICQEIGLAKTDPELYEQIIQDHDLQAVNMVILDDTCPNLQAAHEVGIKTVYLGKNNCASADQVINSLNDFFVILEKK